VQPKPNDHHIVICYYELQYGKGLEETEEVFIKIHVFWVVAPCSLVEVYQRFRGPCCLHHHGDEYQTTRRYNPEDSHLRTHRRENLKSYNVKYVF
jgi:hypothetical protein